jgi:ATP-binding protein involved in chromosome partitioning
MTAAVRTSSIGEGNRQPVPGVKNVIAVGAGKGGVGKTTVAVNLAVALAQTGSRVAMIDGDIYGPNVPMMLGLDTQLVADDQGRIIPAEAFGIQVVSMGFMTNGRLGRHLARADVARRDPAILPASCMERRGLSGRRPAARDGDVALSLSQSVPVSGAIRRHHSAESVAGRHAAGRADVPEAEYPDAGANREHEPLRMPVVRCRDGPVRAGGRRGPRTEMSLPFLGRLPIYQPIRVGGDTGRPIVVEEPHSAAARAFRAVAEQAAAQVSIASYNRVIPLTPVR